MTFSLVARSTDGSQWGVAVASKFLAVGAAVPAARLGVGALATQAMANLTYRPEGLRLLGEGRSAQETVEALTQGDPQGPGGVLVETVEDEPRLLRREFVEQLATGHPSAPASSTRARMVFIVVTSRSPSWVNSG